MKPLPTLSRLLISVSQVIIFILLFAGPAMIWAQGTICYTTIQANNPTFQKRFGYDVDIDGDIALIGEPDGNGEKGAAYIFRKTGNNWTQEAILTASDGELYDYFGSSVALSGEVAVVGYKKLSQIQLILSPTTFLVQICRFTKI